MVIRHTVAVDNLVGVTHISLVAIVEPSVAASHQHNPQISILKEIFRYSNMLIAHVKLILPQESRVGP